MPAAVCPRCQRANPMEAAYCHFDGFSLRAGVGSPAILGALPQPFVFPSGRRCKTFDELAQGCQEDWEDARTILRAGGFEKFLAGVGRADLARLAIESRKQLDADIALHDFVAGLPGTQVIGPKLDLQPRRITLDALHAGETRQVKLVIGNGGQGLLQGKLAVDDSDWLHLIDGNDTGQCSIKTAHEQVVTVLIDTRGLAAPHHYTARLKLITNGGIAEIPVTIELAAIPFSHSPFKGVSSPREMAERLRAQPKPAVPLLENGEMGRWFTANGWVCPMSEPIAKGVAAVQQFFEGMGLSKPPMVHLSVTEARFTCRPPEVVQGEVLLTTPARKWIYAHSVSSEPWLKVAQADISGPQQCSLTYEIDSRLARPGAMQNATLTILANAGQKLTLRVTASVGPGPVRTPTRSGGPIIAAVVLFALLRLALALPMDIFSRVLAPATRLPGAIGYWASPPVLEGGFAARVVLALWWMGAIAGGMALVKREKRVMDVLYGIVAGSVAGLLGSATLACLWSVLDAPGRVLWKFYAALAEGTALDGHAWLTIPLWIITACAGWALAGGFLALLAQNSGARGRKLWAALMRPFSGLVNTAGQNESELAAAR